MRRRNYFRGPHQIKNTVGTVPGTVPVPTVPLPPSHHLFRRRCCSKFLFPKYLTCLTV